MSESNSFRRIQLPILSEEIEVKSTPSSLYGDRDGDRGAGGKFGKSHVRKRPATPYDRPPVSLATRGSSSSWWSKLGDPAYRLVSGATKLILPSFLTKSPVILPSNEPERASQEEDKLDLEVIPNAKDDDPCTSSYDMPSFCQRTEPSQVASDRLKTTFESEECGQDRPKTLSDASQLSKIEQFIKGNTFARDEINRLTEILNSKVGNLSVVDGEKRNETTNSGHTAGVKLTSFPRVSDEGNQENVSRAIARTPRTLLYSNAQDDFGASPIDIAKAYMGSRMLEPGRGSDNSLPKDETAAHSNDEFVLKPFSPSYSHKSSTCWPGAVVHDPRGHITPSQIGRYRLHDFPRTPYSRTIYSKSRSKLTQLQADSSQTTSSKAFQQMWTPIFGQGKSRNDALADNYGSVGPVRRIRNKFSSEARSRGSILLNPSKDASSFQQASASKGFAPMRENNLEPAETSKHWPGDHSGNRFEESVQTLNPSPSQAVKKIMEQFDRNKPTPKEKAAELNLAMSWRKSLPEASDAVQKENINVLGSGKFGSLQNADSFEPPLLSQGNRTKGNSDSLTKLQKRSIEAEDAVVTSSKTSGMVIGDFETINCVNAGASFSQMKSFQQEASVEIKNAKEIGPNSSLHTQSNGQHVTNVSSKFQFELAKKAIQQPSGTKPVLTHISVGRHDANRAVSFDNGAGFTFPFSSSSSVFSEPPTPSFMPVSSSSTVSDSKEVPTVPSYNFGTEKSAPRLVFSFPSSSSAPNHVDSLDPKFNFGSDKKPRLSFGSMGKDAICY